MSIKILSVLFLGLCLGLSSCGVYSFSGANTGLASSVSVQFFENKADIIIPELSQEFTEALRQKFLTDTRLDVKNKDGDLDISGTIIEYRIRPSAISGANDLAEQNRLTLSVRVKYIDKLEPKNNLEQKFSQFVDFPADQPLEALESGLKEELFEKILTDIFNATVNNW